MVDGLPQRVIERSDVEFVVEGERCAGCLLLPSQGKRPLSCVVMAHGTTGTMDLGLSAYAERFSGAGHAVLVFDYRHFGSSEGEPRQLVDVRRQVEDVRAALAFVRSRPEVDVNRIVLWGTSLGAGHAITVSAFDTALAASIAQLPFLGVDPRHGSPRPLWVTLKLFGLAVVDVVGGLVGRAPIMVPMLGLPGQFAIFAGAEDYEAMRELQASAPTWKNQMAARSLFSLLRYRPANLSGQVHIPLLIAAVDGDTVTSMRLIEEVARRAHRTELLHYPGGHFSAYTGPVFERMVADEIAFVARHLT